MGFGTHYPKIQYLEAMNVKAEGVGASNWKDIQCSLPSFLLISPKDKGPQAKSTITGRPCAPRLL